jgi:hypothetical protein
MIESDPSASWKTFYDEIILKEGMGHLYFLLLRFSYFFFGYSTLTARLFSAFTGIASVYAIYFLGRTLFNKRAGIIAALLLSVNFFHINYSQEVRPYALWMLLTILSFYALVVFIKRPSAKTGIVYGIFTGLVVNVHSVGLLSVPGQGLLLLYVYLLKNKQDRKEFLKYGLYALGTFLVLFALVLQMLIKMTHYKSGWLTLPGPDGFADIFRQFLGDYEILTWIFGLIMIFYLMKLFNRKAPPNDLNALLENRLVWSSYVFFFWIFPPIVLAILKSYLDEPMILNRYFINLLPAVVCMLAIGIDMIKNKTVIWSLLSAIVLFSLLNIFVVKKYYTVPSKTQFREATHFVLENNTDKSPIYTSYPWHMGYFLNAKTGSPSPIEKPFETLVDEMRTDSLKIKPFWYLDGFLKPLTLSPEATDFLAKHFYLKDSYDGFGVFTRHYVLPTKGNMTVDISQYKPLQKVNGEKFNFNIDIFEFNGQTLNIFGWAFFDGQDAKSTRVRVLLLRGEDAIPLETGTYLRHDVTTANDNQFDLDNSGFSINQDIKNLESGHYTIAIMLTEKNSGKEGLILTDKTFDK